MPAAIADPAKLAVGDAFPTVEADSVAGKQVVLPADLRGTPFVAIFGFTRKAGDAESKWSDALYQALPRDIAIYAVADLSHIPGLFRGLAISGIRREVSPDQTQARNHLLLLTRANVWSQIVPAGSDDDAVIVAVDQTGMVTDIERRAFNDAAATEIAKTIVRGSATPAK